MRARCASPRTATPWSSSSVSSAATGASARARKRDLARHSAISAAGSLSSVIALPSPARSRPPSNSTVRIGTLKVATPPGWIRPRAPQYQPRGMGSSSRMTCIARTLGAPVTEPQGNSAANASASVSPGRLTAVTVDVICQTVGSASSSNSRGTRTVPSCATRLRSLRSRSTIIRFSALSFSLVRKWAWAASSSTRSRPRGAVPFIGWAASSQLALAPGTGRQSKKSSGDTLATPASRRNRQKPPGWLACSARNSWAGSSTGASARSRVVRLTW
mmetsp:Transcript_5216/g.19489  ORF Transcript_5216/g.19489 Transcript_5216/m.19489 type:complete len:274 (+) Transcript_5216:349-1170(+)